MLNTVIHTKNLSGSIYINLNNQGQVLQFALTQQQHILGRDRTSSDLVVPENWQVVGRIQAVFRREGNNYRIYDGDGQKPSTNGVYVNNTRVTTDTGLLLRNGMEIKIGLNPQNLIEFKYYNAADDITIDNQSFPVISLRNLKVLIGRDSSATLTLDAPTVSRRHATIDTDARGQYVLRDHSSNGVYVNGQRVNGSIILPPEATIRIAAYTLVVRGDELHVLDGGNQIRLDAYNLVLATKGKRRLDDLSFAIEPGQFVALVGGSGAGKSTLMRTLLGIEKLTQGVVYLNGENLRTNFNLYRTQIGYVPQDDIIHRDLTVTEVLQYAAKLRLPPDIDVGTMVEKTLHDVEMIHRRHALVSQLSGGQRKRVSIGVELLADPKLFFLDEPTSGLDPGLDKKMMQLLRKLANQGRTVILVTHATSNIKLCDRIVFLGQGGRLCYFGTPDDCLQFFGVTEDFADIYNLLETPETVIDQAQRFYQSPDYQRYVVNHLSPGSAGMQVKTDNTLQVKVSFGKQWIILTQRYFQTQKRDIINLILALLTAPVGISLITFALQNQQPLVAPAETNANHASLALRVLFVFTCAALWVGLLSSLQEIVKEAAIYLRERLVNLGLFAYLGSKLAIFAGLALLQTLLISLVILFFFKSPPADKIPWEIGLPMTTFLTLLTSMSLGLLISAIVKNGSQANSALPLLLIPQIIFSGVLFKMEGLGSKISWLMLSRWSIGAYGTLVNINRMVPDAIKLPDGSTIARPIDPSPVYDATWQNLSLNWGILGVHIGVYLIVTLLIQKRKDIF
ncbi:ATP-binding cassette domain-containing protein [Scytonema sp. UIC 10036]|uniref:ATP-binding cassette domain-containing protein n=1 Tax=Scytonema sp. UIC 10036 TaxID=2304196 RepID=UPI0012DAEE9D|nr:ATP-binding cassette domain-containing protein [Scytonema sp. UIC 10036]MUG92000.1 ATP-binding cassette domain-containing protein [Scytonema sp. UIC 10036]